MSARLRVKCEKCGSRCEKQIGAGAGIIFKGSGFYETDYKRKSVAPAGETKAEGKAESKPPEKSESTSAKAAAD